MRVDLVMMPTHGHGLFRGLLLGSVTSKVLHDVHCPVWTAAHAEKQHAQEVPRKILCALDGSEGSLALAQWAVDFSRQMGASLQLLHVVRTISDWLSLESEQELQEELRAERAQPHRDQPEVRRIGFAAAGRRRRDCGHHH